MITYVNTVLVSNTNGGLLTEEPAKASSMSAASADAGKFIMMNCDNGDAEGDPSLYTTTADTKVFKIGIVTSKNITVAKKDGTVEYWPIVKWSNEIKAADIKSLTKLTYQDDTEDSIEIDLTSMSQDVATLLADGGKRVILRLTFKDLPTRYRKWTESYEYVTIAGDDATAIATGLANQINSQYKRARVVATAASGVLTLEAMPYDDDNDPDTWNWAGKVRFNANMYFTDPQAAGFASRNKYSIIGATITKTPGVQYPASAKLVRDRESQALGYQGILNRLAEPAIKPALETNIAGKYDGLTLEFENMYRAADDIFRKTKQTVEAYADKDNTSGVDDLITALETIIAANTAVPTVDNKEYGKDSE